ncbi:hypothetical protein CHS0354_018820 [Potamilus streckersoni]|uniref:OTU domain-containing protein n=1 Tax=Potamilus streckersoni TaxID=2493646 RepID=A0AAE0TJW1_9BIVA|nr:hypothetical protein CHS0354_018820 [Potamilus streckersoni]
MRGDGNCLFRTFSYIIFGVQTHYAEIREKMWEDGKWGTDVEIRAVASMLNTNVYVYCTYGTEQNCSWNKYTPINSASESSMFILHRNDHYEPVLDVEDCEFQDLFSRPPYLPIRKYVPEKYWKYVSAQTLEAALVNNYNDEKILQEMRECPDTVKKSETNVFDLFITTQEKKTFPSQTD